MPGWGAIIICVALALFGMGVLVLIRRERHAARREVEEMRDEWGAADHYFVFHEDAQQ